MNVALRIFYRAPFFSRRDVRVVPLPTCLERDAPGRRRLFRDFYARGRFCPSYGGILLIAVSLNGIHVVVRRLDTIRAIMPDIFIRYVSDNFSRTPYVYSGMRNEKISARLRT